MLYKLTPHFQMADFCQKEALYIHAKIGYVVGLCYLLDFYKIMKPNQPSVFVQVT